MPIVYPGEPHARCRTLVIFFLSLLAIRVCVSPDISRADSSRRASPANILFVIMDDVGIDQMKAFGYGGATAPKTDTIDLLARSGVRFRNTWSMPECSPSRAAFFTGRYPLRTNIYQAIGPNDLSNSHVSPYETTTPRLLEGRGYTSALFGKFHLGGPENNPFGDGAPASVGFDYFNGYIGGLPASIDTTAGGVADPGTYSCGFVTDATQGACRFPSGRCDGRIGGPLPGKRCLEQGGIFVPNATCAESRERPLNFNVENAHYVSPIIVNRRNGKVTERSLSDPRARTYRSTFEVDAARNWINQRPAGRPWMATVSFSADHTPIQCPPDRLLSRDSRTGNNSLDCANMGQQRGLSDRMIEAMDRELGRLLVETGMARRSRTGRLSLTPKGKKTMIVVAGDNGSYGPTVKLPFDPARAKGTVYQSGVWVPLIVSGPLVKRPNRDVEHMVNIVDVFALFGEIAGVDATRRVPRTIDAQPLLPYLKNPQQSAIRTINFTQSGMNIQATPFGNGPCVLGSSCSQIPVSKSVCEDNAGVWWGEGADDPSVGVGSAGARNCCGVNEYLSNANLPTVQVLPTGVATRNERYKLVRNSALDYDPGTQSCVTLETVEFYAIDQNANNPALDRDGSELPLDSLTSEQQSNYDALSAGMDAILASQPTCPGDGNIDGVVDEKDIAGWNRFVRKTGENLDEDPELTSSVFDFNFDGLTNESDLAIIQQNLGRTCS